MATKTNTSQDFVPVKEIRNGIITLKDGSLRAILMLSSLNLALKSEDEQNAIINQFQNFLNSLEFTIQIFIQSRKLDIRPYVALLEKQYANNTNELLQIQIREYIEFVKSFVASSNIMTKNFFIVVPYSPAVLQGKGSSISNIFSRAGKKEKREQANQNFEENLSQLEQRMAVIEQGIARTGIRSVKLDTEEAIELFYKIFNPGEQEKPIHLPNTE